MRNAQTIYNERAELFAGFLNALALGILGLAVLGAVTDDIGGVTWAILPWAAIGIAIHLAAHCVLGTLRQEIS